MSETSIPVQPLRKHTPLSYLLIFVFALFVGILIMVYVITKRSNPIQLDEHGKPVNSQLLSVPESITHV